MMGHGWGPVFGPKQGELSMQRFRAWGLSAALTANLGLCGAVAAEPGAAAAGAATQPWYSRLFRSDSRRETDTAATPPPRRPSLPMAPLSPEQIAEALRAEQDAYLRRLEICTKLRQVALHQDDESLLKQADDIERQATMLYHSRVARLGVKGLQTPSPSRSQGSAQAVLDAKLSSEMTRDPRSVPAKSLQEPPATASNLNFRRAPQP